MENIIEKKFAIRTKTYVGFCRVLTKMFRDGLKWKGGNADITEKDWNRYGEFTCLSVSFNGIPVNQKGIQEKISVLDKTENKLDALIGLLKIANSVLEAKRVGVRGIGVGSLDGFRKDGHKIYSVNDFVDGKVEEYESQIKKDAE